MSRPPINSENEPNTAFPIPVAHTQNSPTFESRPTLELLKAAELYIKVLG